MPSLPGGRSREEGEITCRVRSPFVPEAKRKKNIWQGFLLPSPVYPPFFLLPSSFFLFFYPLPVL